MTQTKTSGRRAQARKTSHGLVSIAATSALVASALIASGPSLAETTITVESITKVTLITGSVGPAVGDTVWASAFERYLSRDLFAPITLGLEDPVDDPEEYVYRITTQPNVAATSVDPQSSNQALPAYSSLTSQMQEDWYTELGFDNDNPYRFRWSAFLCLDDGNAEETTNLAVNYVSLEDGLASGVLDSTVNAHFNDAVVSIEGLSHPSNVTVVGNSADYHLEFQGTWDSSSGFASLGISKVSATCPNGSSLEALDILVTANPILGETTPNPIRTKSLQIPEQLKVWDPSGQKVVTVPSLGVTIGVTGVASSPFNAALWGITTIRETTSGGDTGGGSGDAEPDVTQPAQPYAGPIITSFSERLLSTTKETRVVIEGLRLNTVTGLSIGGTDVKFVRNDAGQLVATIPPLASGNYDLVVRSQSSGILTHQDAFTVLQSIVGENISGTPNLVANASRSLRYENFSGDNFSLPRNARLGITRTLTSLDQVTRIVCRGWTSGTRVTSQDQRLALRRAQEACTLASRLHPNAEVVVKTSPAAGLGPRFRSVSVFVAYSRD